MYCDFYSASDKETLIPEFVKALILEIERCQVETQDLEIETIFIGGGTPSLLKSKYIDLIVNALHKKHNLDNVKEFTIEANPGEASKKKVKKFLKTWNKPFINWRSIIEPKHFKVLNEDT